MSRPFGTGWLRFLIVGVRSLESRVGAGLEAIAAVASFQDVAAMGQTIEQRGGHLRIAEHVRSLGEAEVGRDD